jgi:hypothetical protein
VPTPAKSYISVVSAAGVAAMAYAFLLPSRPRDLFRFGIYFLLSLLAAMLKLRLPGLTGTMSLGFVFVLLSISELTLPETMSIATAGVVLQCLWRVKVRPTSAQVVFSVSAVAVAALLAFGATGLVRSRLHLDSVTILLAVATCVYFLANSALISGVLSFVKRESFAAVWQHCYLVAFPYYLLGGVVAGLVAASGRQFGWPPALLIMPAMGMIFLFYRLYLARFLATPSAIPTQPAALRAVQSRTA